MRIRSHPAYSFDDVLLVPHHSDIASRKDVDLMTCLGDIELSLPIVSANMDTVTEVEMAIAMGEAGGAGILHRFAPADQILEWTQRCLDHDAPPIISVGANLDRALSLVHMTLPYIWGVCVDVAHGDHSRAYEVVKAIRDHYGNTIGNIIAGNVATGTGAKRLVEAGANIIKIGIGPGSVCTTRIVSGHGFPQLSAIDEIHLALRLEGRREDNANKVFIIADGGIRYPGDIVKALAAGADAVMIGALLAGTDEAAGERIIEHGVTYKTFRGMASREAQRNNGAVPRVEGVAARVPYRGPVSDTLANLEAGIRSGFSYSGARNLVELRNKAEFVVVTGNTLKENHPHHPYVL